LKNKLDQSKKPFFESVLNYISKGRTSFHMPGHTRGRGAPPELLEFFGKNVYLADLTEVEGLDYLHKPIGIVKEAQELAADAFGVDYSFFLVNGSTVGVIAMILASVKPKEKLILQRNSHRSAIAGLVLGQIEPIFIQSNFNSELGIFTGITPDDLLKCIMKNPDAKAVLLTSPNYYGMATDLDGLIKVARDHKLTVLVDEAHGVHFHFNPYLPKSAVDLRADMVVQSIHKTLPSFTQTSILHLNEDKIEKERIQTLLAYLQTSSPSYLFMMSIDAVRSYMAIKGKEIIDREIEIANFARAEIKKFKYIKSFNKNDIIGKDGVFDFDPTKLTITTKYAGYSGFEVESILNSKFNIEIELSDMNNILCFITAGSSTEDIKKLTSALTYFDENKKIMDNEFEIELPNIPPLKMLPTLTFSKTPELIPFSESAGAISYDVICPYPPGIPLLIPGEIITEEVVEFINKLKRKGADIQGLTQNNKIKVVNN
jgi:lysine decarboxylase